MTRENTDSMGASQRAERKHIKRIGKAGTMRLKTEKLHYGECLNNDATMMKR